MTSVWRLGTLEMGHVNCKKKLYCHVNAKVEYKIVTHKQQYHVWEQFIKSNLASQINDIKDKKIFKKEISNVKDTVRANALTVSRANALTVAKRFFNTTV